MNTLQRLNRAIYRYPLHNPFNQLLSVGLHPLSLTRDICGTSASAW